MISGIEADMAAWRAPALFVSGVVLVSAAALLTAPRIRAVERQLGDAVTQVSEKDRPIAATKSEAHGLTGRLHYATAQLTTTEEQMAETRKRHLEAVETARIAADR